MRLVTGQKILMIGDSITDAGRRDVDPPYGHGYVAQIRDQFTAQNPDLEIIWENRGVAGDTVRHLASRWQQDVIDERSDLLTVMIGINDVWRRFDDNPFDAVPADEYVSTLVTLLRLARDETGASIVVASPYVMERDRQDPMRAAMDIYGDLARQVAEEVGADFIDVQAAFDRALKTSSSAELCDARDDRIHPNAAGHQVITDAFLKVLEAYGNHP